MKKYLLAPSIISLVKYILIREFLLNRPPHSCKHIYNSHWPSRKPNIVNKLAPLPKKNFIIFPPSKKNKTPNRTIQTPAEPIKETAIFHSQKSP